jgi:TPR repeat protein
MRPPAFAFTLFLLPLISGSVLAEPPATVTDDTKATPEPTYEAARNLLKGNGGEADARKGFELMLQAANQDHLPAIAGVAYLYNVGMGTAKNLAEAITWFRKAAERGHAVSQYNLGKLLIAEETPLQAGFPDLTAQHNEGLEWLRKAAAQGQDDARTTYGIILMNGDMGLKPDPAAAARSYLIPAADAGNTEAMNALGTLYQSGNGVSYDPAAAEVFFRKAAMAGNVKAQANLGEHLDPSSKKENLRIEALAWLFIAEGEKNAVAKKILQNKLPATSPDDAAAARIKAAEIRRQIREQKK